MLNTITQPFFYRWHPEVALRYLPLVKEIKALPGSTILEVGSGGLCITPYLGASVTGLDVEFNPPFHPLLNRVVGSVLQIPFKKDSFDIVVCVDTLEHLQSKHRQKAVI